MRGLSEAQARSQVGYGAGEIASEAASSFLGGNMEPKDYLNKIVLVHGEVTGQGCIGVVTDFESSETLTGKKVELVVNWISPDVQEPVVSWNMISPKNVTVLSDEEIVQRVKKDIEDAHRRYVQDWEYRIEEFAGKKLVFS